MDPRLRAAAAQARVRARRDGGRHEKQREIGLFPENEAELAHYVGRAVRIAGEGPIVGDTAWHVRDLTIMRAKVVDRRPK